MIRIGQGFDVHRLDPDRELILGGVKIEADFGLVGHSDADVLLHSITDAVLGALAWGDIGHWFPDTDEKFRGADSAKLFSEVWSRVRSEGWLLGNLDCTVLAEKPKLAPHVNRIRKRLAELFFAELEQLSLKATTCEGLGFVGREEGIAASSSVLLIKKIP